MNKNQIFYILNYYFLRYVSFELWHVIMFRLNSLRYEGECYRINFKSPKSFNEKLIFLKTKKPSKLNILVADKINVREYVKSKIGDEYLIPLLWSSDNIDDFDQEKIKKNCIIKLNNGSGKNFIIKDDISSLEFKKIKQTFYKLFTMDFSMYSRELHYKYIKPRIIIEKLLDFPLNDYKFFCSNGQPFMIQVDVDRFTNHRRNFYDLNWNKKNITLNYKNYKSLIPPPKQLNLMIKIAKKLSSDFNFCRIDLYESKEKVFFGEITLFPGGGVELFKEYKMDLDMGDYIKLN